MQWRNAVHGRLCRRADGSGVGDVKTRVQPVVDAGQDNIRAEWEQCVQRNLDTIGGVPSTLQAASTGTGKS